MRRRAVGVRGAFPNCLIHPASAFPPACASSGVGAGCAPAPQADGGSVDSAIQNFLNELVMMWVLIDPIGTVPVFLMVTASLKEEHRRMIATRAVLVSAAILLAFLFGGHILLRALGIPLPSFQIAGGIVLFLFALTMIFGPSKEEQQKEESSVSALERAKSVAVFPLAIPSIASPGAMLGVVLLNDTEKLQWESTLSTCW